MRLCCVAANAAIDKTYVVSGFRQGGTYRLETVVPVAGGKALNAAKTARLLGVEEVVCTGFVAGRAGDWIRRDLAARGIREAFVQVPGESREDILIVDPSGGAETRLLEPGVAVDAAELEALTGRVRDLARSSALVILAGSLHRGCPDNLYARLVDELRRMGTRVFLDADGEALRQAVPAGPDLIKVNEEEFAALNRRSAGCLEDLVTSGQRMLGQGALVVTLGARGAVWIGPEGALLAEGPRVAPLMTVGSGDAFLGGYAAAVLRGEAPAAALALGVAAGTANTLCLGPGVVDPAEVESLRGRVQITTLGAGSRLPHQ
ncbi:MAG: hexose kinase [candidate division NC10 bacterium]|nr:hexose kinase [candidate division NC10 bacterium]